MGVTRARAVKRRKKKEIKTTLKWVMYPPAILGATLFSIVKKKPKRKKID